MIREKTWEQETLELLREVQQETQLARQRVAQAQDALVAAQRREDAIRATLDMYRERYGLSPLKDNLDEINEEVRQGYQGLSLPDMIRHWADEHDGEVILREMSRTLAAAGLWRNRRSANGSLHATMSRMKDFEKVRPGEYRRREDLVHVLTAGLSQIGAAMQGVSVPGEPSPQSLPLPDKSLANGRTA